MKRLSLVIFGCLLFLVPALLFSAGSIGSHFEVECRQIDSLNVRFVSNWPFGNSHAVEIDSLRALSFLGAGGGVFVFDVSNPATPVLLSEGIRTGGLVYDLHYEGSGQMLFIASEGIGLEIWDVSNPSQPQFIGRCNVPHLATGVFALGNFAYVADWNSGLFVIDVSDPCHPLEVGLWNESYGWRVFVKDTVAYVASGRLYLVSVADPANPYTLSNHNVNCLVMDVVVHDTLAYIVAEDSLDMQVLNIANPAHPIMVGFCSAGSFHRGIAVKDSFAFIGGFYGLLVLNVSDPANPVVLDSCRSGARSVAASSHEVYFAGWRWDNGDPLQGLVIIDVSIPSNPVVAGNYETIAAINGVCIEEPYAFLVGQASEMFVVDLSDIKKPNLVSSVSVMARDAQRIVLLDTLAYIAECGPPGFEIIDISDPLNPVSVGYLGLSGGALCVQVTDTFAYVGCGGNDHGLKIINIADPNNPFEISHFNLSGRAFGIDVVDSLVYIAADNLHIINVSNPTSPQQIGYFQTDAWAQGIDVEDHVAYVCDGDVGNTGLRTIDVSDPMAPFELAFYYSPGQPKDCLYKESYLYLADGSGGIQVVDVLYPSNPIEAGYYISPAYAVNVTLDDDFVYVANRECGLQIYEFYGAGVEEEEQVIGYQPSFQLLQNPVRGGFLGVLLPANMKGKAELELYNLVGQRVRRFSVERGARNRAQLYVDDICSGVYFLRVKGDMQQTLKVTVMK
jgi:hypothetical protein